MESDDDAFSVSVAHIAFGVHADAVARSRGPEEQASSGLAMIGIRPTAAGLLQNRGFNLETSMCVSATADVRQQQCVRFANIFSSLTFSDLISSTQSLSWTTLLALIRL
jgi:hypothetical protein